MTARDGKKGPDNWKIGVASKCASPEVWEDNDALGGTSCERKRQPKVTAAITLVHLFGEGRGGRDL